MLFRSTDQCNCCLVDILRTTQALNSTPRIHSTETLIIIDMVKLKLTYEWGTPTPITSNSVLLSEPLTNDQLAHVIEGGYPTPIELCFVKDLRPEKFSIRPPVTCVYLKKRRGHIAKYRSFTLLMIVLILVSGSIRKSN